MVFSTEREPAHPVINDSPQTVHHVRPMLHAARNSISKMPEGFITCRGVAHAQNSHDERVVVAMTTNNRHHPPF